MNSVKRVLIIEDERPMAMALEIKLKKVGLEAKAVFDGQEGIKELETGNFDLALLDIMMPIIDGWAVLNHVIEKKIKTKIIITSNLSQSEDIKKAKELGAIDFLVKSDNAIADIANKVMSYLK